MSLGFVFLQASVRGGLCTSNLSRNNLPALNLLLQLHFLMLQTNEDRHQPGQKIDAAKAGLCLSAVNLLRGDGTERSDGWRRRVVLAGKRQSHSRPEKKNKHVQAGCSVCGGEAAQSRKSNSNLTVSQEENETQLKVVPQRIQAISDGPRHAY